MFKDFRKHFKNNKAIHKIKDKQKRTFSEKNTRTLKLKKFLQSFNNNAV